MQKKRTKEIGLLIVMEITKNEKNRTIKQIEKMVHKYEKW